MRRVITLAVGLVVSTLLLGGGWLLATLRQQETQVAEERERLMRAADAVRGAVDESLEELRRREDERPFYLYQHFYSPPDVLAITDPVAVSPLARAPDDLRLRGHFQLDPGGRVRTPYAADTEPEADAGERHAEVVRRVSAPAFDPLRALVRGEASRTLVGDAREPSPAVDLALAMRQNPDNQLTDLDTYGNVQARDILAAQSGDRFANQRVMERGRQVAPSTRRDVSWEQAVQQQAAPAPPPPRPPSRSEIQATLEGAADAVRACTPTSTRVRLRVSERGDVLRASSEPESACVVRAMEQLRFPSFDGGALTLRYGYQSADAHLELADGRDLERRVRRAEEVEYTPMTFRALGGEWVLHRLVSLDGTSVVQGVVLDRAHLVEAWLPAVVARHADPSVAPAIVSAGDADCAIREPASATLPDVELCFAPAMLEVAALGRGGELRFQLAALTLLVLIALLAAGAIVRYARRAEALSRQKSAFVSAVSHELRTPLTTLRMHAEMLEEGMVDDARRPKVHRELVRESVRLARLVDNVLSLSKLEEGRRRIAPAEGDLRAHVREVVEGQRRFVEEKGFALEAPAEGSLTAVFDGQAVEQIVVNLLDNAVKYAATGERAIEVAVEADPDGRAVLVVRDRGPGIPERERHKVFERFHRVEREDTAHAPGTGIGLSLVAELAEAHGGSAAVHPREGGGLEVRVRL